MRKIAWIEDEADAISSLVRLLELNNYEVARYRTREDVDEKIGEIILADAIILDLVLPPATEEEPYQGISILKQLRQIYHYINPVVVCSVVRTPDIIATLTDMDVSAILHKPIRPSVLFEVVGRLVLQNSGEKEIDDGTI
jgi:DNA-binding response OmpR family regulator